MTSKFNNNNLEDEQELSKKIEEVNEEIVEQSLDLQKEDLKDYNHNKDFVESVGVEYQDLMNQMGDSRQKESKKILSNVEESMNNNVSFIQGNQEAKEKCEVIKSNIDDLEEKLAQLRAKKKQDEEVLLERQRLMNKKLNSVIENQTKKQNLKEEEIEDDVTQGIEERLNHTTKKNLLLKEKNIELNDIIVQKNAHIARIMRELREVKNERNTLFNQVEEAKKLLDFKEKQMAKMIVKEKDTQQIEEEIQQNRV